MWYINFLRSSNGDIYVGSTNDLRRRITSHEQGDVASTRAYHPVTLTSYMAVQTEIRPENLSDISSPVRVRHSQTTGFGNKRILGPGGDKFAPDCPHRHHTLTSSASGGRHALGPTSRRRHCPHRHPAPCAPAALLHADDQTKNLSEMSERTWPTDTKENQVIPCRLIYQIHGYRSVNRIK